MKRQKINFTMKCMFEEREEEKNSTVIVYIFYHQLHQRLLLLLSNTQTSTFNANWIKSHPSEMYICSKICANVDPVTTFAEFDRKPESVFRILYICAITLPTASSSFWYAFASPISVWTQPGSKWFTLARIAPTTTNDTVSQSTDREIRETIKHQQKIMLKMNWILDKTERFIDSYLPVKKVLLFVRIYRSINSWRPDSLWICIDFEIS